MAANKEDRTYRLMTVWKEMREKSEQPTGGFVTYCMYLSIHKNINS